MTLGEFRLESAKIVFTDDSNPQPFHATVEPLTVALRNFTTARDGHAELLLAAATDAGERLTIAGRLGMEPLSFDGTLGCKGIALPRFAPYYASQILFDVRQGTLDLSVPMRLTMKKKVLDLTIAGLRADLRDLQLRRRGDRDDFLRLPELFVHETNMDLARRELVLGDIATSGARIRLERSGPAQPWNLETLFPTPAVAARATPPRAIAEHEARESPFAVTVQKLDLKDWAVRVEDRAPRTAAITSLDRITLRVDGLSTAHGHVGRVGLQARLNQAGTISVTGGVGITPLQADVQLKLKMLPIVPLQPYFQDSMALLLTSGHVGANGRAVLTSGPKGPSVTYKGEFVVADVVADTPDGSEELARLGELRASGIDITTLPFKLNIAEIAISDYGAQVVINPNQSINLASIVPGDRKGTGKPTSPEAKPESASSPASKSDATPPSNVRVGAIVLRGGNIHITD